MRRAGLLVALVLAHIPASVRADVQPDAPADATGPTHPGVPLWPGSAQRVHFSVDATATYGIGIYSALGGQLHGVANTQAWETPPVSGSVDVGLLLGAQDEPEFFQYIPPGYPGHAKTERLNAWATVGHTFHFAESRRWGLGVHIFAGWTHVWSTYTQNDPAHGIVGKLSDNFGHFNVGGMLKFDYRFSDWVGVSVQAVGPFPVAPSYITTLFHVGAGLVFYLD